MPAKNLLKSFTRFFLLPLSSLSNRLGNGFYIGLAVVVCATAVFAIATGSTAAIHSHVGVCLTSSGIGFIISSPMPVQKMPSREHVPSPH